MSQYPSSFTLYTGLDREGARRLVNDIMYKPSPEELAVLEQCEADKKERRKSEKTMRPSKHHNNAGAEATTAYSTYTYTYDTVPYTHTYRPSSTAEEEDGASVFSAGSASTYNSFRKLLSRKGHHGKTAR
ncbi:hypothetical protein SCUCBS95973_006924 [Sporothrix curviconia]|uniref:Uncharacterized protein n=1 Tax=Sporothrix curviconia TaxID=1260050 RepID=A0ABP0CBN9_9PEZI